MFNTAERYGWVARLLHWVMALAIFSMFGLGLWMRELDYYSPYYKSAPDLHKSIGLVLLVVLVFRLIWKLVNKSPVHEDITPFERKASHFVHLILYPLLFVLMIAGYFISTADGRPILMFGAIEVPALVNRKGLEAVAGIIHYYIAFVIIAVAVFHAFAALYHHFVKRDGVLLCMLPRRIRKNS